MRNVWRVTAWAAVLLLVAACSGVPDRRAALDPTECRIEPGVELDMPAPDVREWMDTPSSWVLVDSAEVSEPEAVELSAAERGVAEQWEDGWREVTPLVIQDVRGEVLRGDLPGRLVVDPNLAAGVHQHSEAGRRALLGTGESDFQAQAYALVGDGRVEVLGFCMARWRAAHIEGVVEELGAGPPDLRLHVTPEELLLTLITEPDGELAAAVDRVVHGRGREPDR